MNSSQSLQLNLISCTSAFVALQSEWNALYEVAERSTIFSSWDWMYTWWETFSDSDRRDLFILSFYDNNLLVGVAPFQIERKYPHAYIQGRTLRFLASGERIEDSIATPFIDLMVRPGYDDAVVKGVESAVNRYQRRWDFAEFDFLQENSLIFRCFKRSEQGIKSQIYPYGYRYQVPPVATQSEYLETIPNRWQKDYRKKNRLFARDGDVNVVMSNAGNVAESLAELRAMHRDRWENRADFLIFESERFMAFHQRILERLIPQGKAYIKVLTLNDKPLSSYYAFTDKHQVHYYQSAFYRENANRYMPLFYQVCNEIGLAMEQGDSFDFMFDDNENSYKKQQYAAESTPMYRLVWTPSQYRLSAFNFYKAFKKINSAGKQRLRANLKNSLPTTG